MFNNTVDQADNFIHVAINVFYTIIDMLNPIKPVKLSQKAIVEVRNIMQHKNIPEEYGLRIGMKGGGGCGAGMSYLIGFDKKKSTDIEYYEGDIPIYIEKKHTMYLIGLEVDFHEGADTRGFAFIKAETANEG